MPSINRRELSEEYGFALSVLDSNPELKRLFDRAVKGSWTPDRFLAGVRNTKWFKRTAESVRNAQIQKGADPASYRAAVAQVRARVGIMAGEYGAQISSQMADKIATNAYNHGWDDNQLRRNLAKFVKRSDKGVLEGQAGEWSRQWKDHARAMGINYGSAQYQRWASQAIAGQIAPEDVVGYINKTAKSRYPHLAGRIDGGETLEDIAEPYRQTVGELLEVDPGAVSLASSLVKKGLTTRTSDGHPTSMTLYEFEDLVRKDPRWKRTDNAKKQADGLARNLLTSWGLIS